ncbi:UNVERIFIED_CONTAM: hypothetical protein GTU68_037379 [Idotea baltica]|nr:hypothetical protein [Idotea baltica]
MQKDKDVM